MGIVKYEDDPEMKEYQKSYIELIARKVGDEIYQRLEEKHYDHEQIKKENSNHWNNYRHINISLRSTPEMLKFNHA